MRHLEPMPSRTGTTSPFGKLDDWLERQRIESAVKAEFVKKCTGINKPYAEVVRDVARIVALGPEQAARMYGEGVLKVVPLIVGKSDTK